MRVPLYIMCSFSLFAFKILSLSLIFVSLITLCLSVFLLEFVLPWTLFYILVNHFLHLLNLCLHFPPTSCIIFTSIILNSFSGSLPISTSFSCFSGILSCPFIWDITFYFFILTFCKMVFVLATVGVWFFLLLLSAYWWKRLRGLCKLLDGRDWLWENWVLLWWAGPCSVKH